MLEEIDPRVVGSIINEGEEVLSSTEGTSIYLPTEVTVNEIQWFCCSVTSTSRENRLFVLAFYAGLTKIDLLGVVEIEALYEVVSGQSLQALRVEVPVTLVPQNFLRFLCNTGTLVNFAVKIVETSYSSCLGNQPPI